MSNEAVVKIGLSAREFQQGMRQMQNELRQSMSEFDLASEKAKLFGTTADYLGAQVEKLSAKLEAETAILEEQKTFITQLEGNQLKLAEAQKAVEVSLADLNNERKEALGEYGAESEQVKALDVSIASLNKEYVALDRSIATNNTSLARASAQANRTEISTMRTEASLNSLNRQLATRHLDSFATGMGKISTGADRVASKLMPLSLGIGVVGAASAYNSLKFGDGLAKLSTIADTSKVSMGSFKNQIMELSNQSGESSSQLAEAAYQAISASVKTGDAMEFVKKSSELAKAGFTDLSSSTDLLTGILNSYGLKQSDVNMISNDLIRTQNLGKTTVGALASSMGSVIPTAKATGVSLQQLSSAYVLLTSHSIDTSQSGTMINSMLSELSKHGSKTDVVLRKLTGKGFAGLMKSGKSVSDVLNILNGYAVKNGLSLKDMFGNVRAGKGALVLATDSGKAFNDILTKMNKKGNDTNIAFKKVSATTGFKLRQSLIQLQNSSIKLGDALQPVIEKLASAISKIATSINKLSPAQLKTITEVGLSIIAFTGFMKVLSLVTGGLSSLAKGLSSSVKFFMKGKKGISGFSKLLKGTSKIAKGTGSIIAKSAKGISKAFVFAGKGIGKAAKGIGKRISLMGKGVLKSFSLMGKGISKSAKLISKGTLKSFSLMKTGLIKSSKAIGKGVVSSFKFMGKALANSDKIILKTLKGIKTGAIKSVSLMKKGIINSCKGIQTGVLKSFGLMKTGVIKSIAGIKTGSIKAFGFMKKGILSAGSGIKTGVLKSFSLMKTGTLKSLGLIKDGAIKSFSAMKSGILTASSAIGKGFSKMASVIGSGAKSVISGLKAVWATMLANPITLIIVAIVAIGVALYECYKHCAWFRNKVDYIWKEIKILFQGFLNFFSDVFKGKFTGVLGALVAPLRFFMQNCATTWTSIKLIFNGFIEFFEGIFTGNWSKAFAGLKEIFSGVWNSLSGIASNAMNAVLSIVMPIINSISSAFKGLMNGIHAVGNAASSIGHAAAHAIGLNVVIPHTNEPIHNRPSKFLAMPINTRKPVNFNLASQSATSLNSLNSLTTGISSTGNISKALINEINIEDIITNAIDKVISKIDSSKEHKEIKLKLILNGREIAYASNDYQNKLNGKEINLQKRLRGD